MPGEDFYTILGVTPNATQTDIKASYRHLAMQLHPDHFPGTTPEEQEARAQAEERFKDISEAYDTLGDESKRRLYDFNNNAYSLTAAGQAWTSTTDFAAAAKSQRAKLSRQLHDAVHESRANDVSTLIQQGAMPTSEMLYTATQNYDMETAQALLDAQVMPSEESLRLVVERARTDWVEAFIQHGARPSITTLRMSMRGGFGEIFGILMQAADQLPADQILEMVLNMKTKDDAFLTPALELAVKMGNSNYVRGLIRNGAPLTAKAQAYIKEDGGSFPQPHEKNKKHSWQFWKRNLKPA